MADLRSRLLTALADRYRIERELGRGGMATVFLARDLKHDRPVAIKVLRPELVAAIGAERFLREIQVTANLHHPHILPLHDSGTADGLVFYVTPLVEGKSLRDRLDREQQLPLDDALRIADNVAAALAHAHAHGIIHRDIKPENILLQDGEAVVADFGIARAMGASGGDKLTETGLAVGTPVYMSPEQAIGGSELDARTDVYSLGCVLFEMLVGEVPYPGATAQAIMARKLSEPVPSIRVVRGSVPAAVEHAITKALAKVPADRFGDAGELRDALARAVRPDEQSSRPAGESPTASPESRRALWLGLAVGLLAIIGGATVLLRPRHAATIDPNLVAVAPFDVLDQPLTLWREGLVDLLSANLDGAGPLRTVSPTAVIRRWQGRADPASAIELGHHTGAALVVFGRLTTAGGDSVRVTATLLDVGRHAAVAELERRDRSGRMDRLADSLTIDLLRELGRTRPIGAVRLVSLGSNSFIALKAYLQGEQFLRRAEWGSALTSYERAIRADSTFAPALRRASLALGWMRSGYDSLSLAYSLRAGALNHGLPRRDSLLIAYDSLLSSVLEAGPIAFRADSGWWGRARRLFGTADRVTQQYPDDPEAWYLLGEAREHIGAFLGIGAGRILEAFDHAIALDSAFSPAYIHPIEITSSDGPDAARKYLTPYLALHSNEVEGEGERLVERLLNSSLAWPAGGGGVLDSASSSALNTAFDALSRSADTNETAVHIARELVARATDIPSFIDSLRRVGTLQRALAHRGHLHEAAVRPDTARRLRQELFAEMALVGAVPAESAAVAFATELKSLGVVPLAFALPWWAARSDSASLIAARKRGDLLARSGADPGERERARYVSLASTAYLELARRDTAASLQRFLTLPDSLCPACYLQRVTRAELLVSLGRDREAAPLLASELPSFTIAPAVMDVLWELLRARVADRSGDRELAIREYQYVVDLWRHADPELQPFVAEARAALKRLVSEPKR